MTREEFIAKGPLDFPDHMELIMPCQCEFEECGGWRTVINIPRFLKVYYLTDAPAEVIRRAVSWYENYPDGYFGTFRYGGHFL